MSNARSPREVCSTTIGTSGLIVLASFTSSAGFLPNVAIAGMRPDSTHQQSRFGLAPRGPKLTAPGSLAFFARLARRPQLLTSLRLLDGDRLGLADQEIG